MINLKHAISTIALSVASLSVQAEGWEFFPVIGDNYAFDPAVAVMTGKSRFDDIDNGVVTGLELSINCPLIKPPKNSIRQQISYSQFDKEGTDVRSIELNPHYMFDVNENLHLGAGVNIGFMEVKNDDSDSALTYGVGLSARYDLGSVFMGAEIRQAWADDVELGNQTMSVNNTRSVLKLGYQF